MAARTGLQPDVSSEGPSGPKTLHVRVLAEQDLAALAPEWESLLARSASDTIFLTPEWIRSWWSAYHGGRDLVALRIDDESGLVGLALMYRKDEQILQGFRQSALAFVGDGSADSDYMDWISARGREPDVARAVIEHLRTRTPKWDLLVLREIPDSSPHLGPLEAVARERGWTHHAEQVPCARVPLPRTWDDYLRMLKPRMRTKVRSVLREFEGRPDARFDRCTNPDDLEPRLASLYELHNRRWDMEGKSGIFHAEDKRTFYSLLSQRLLARDWLRFYSLSVEGRYVAHQYCFEYGNRMFLLQEGLDPEWFEHGAGNALRAHAFRDCVERGLDVYDFLAGVTPHKSSWGAEVVHSVRLILGPPSIRNRIAFTARDAREAAKRLLRPERPAPSEDSA
jgi:CelD/BcsL family acetyltransferase involved in cellulose biosynthesis